jgi:hypothetical protein
MVDQRKEFQRDIIHKRKQPESLAIGRSIAYGFMALAFTRDRRYRHRPMRCEGPVPPAVLPPLELLLVVQLS